MKFAVRTNLPGYPVGVLLAFGGVRTDFIIDIMERRGCSRESCLKDWRWEQTPSTVGHTAVFSCHRVMLWFRDLRPSARTIAHEAFHAVRGVLPQLGIPPTDDTEEAYAYALDNMIGLVEDAVAAQG